MRCPGRMAVHRDVLRGEHRIEVTLTDADVVAAGGAYDLDNVEIVEVLS